MNSIFKSKYLFISVLFMTTLFVMIYFGCDYHLKSFQRVVKLFDVKSRTKCQTKCQINCQTKPNSQLIENLSFNFNSSGFPFNVVPNMVHYILFDVEDISFVHFVSLLSVMKNHKPDLIYIHCNCDQLSGDYYERALRIANKTNTQIIVRTIERLTQIFGRKLSRKWLNWHSSDPTRIRILMEFGGIYLDRDVYVVQSLDVFRKYEMSLSWDQIHNFENQLLIANRNARFLKLWLDSYHDYNPNQWYYNAGELPTQRILKKRPELIHSVMRQFGSYAYDICPLLYNSYYENWEKDFYAFHLLIRGNELSMKDWCFQRRKVNIIQVFNEQNVRQLNVTFGQMSRIVFDFEKQINSN